MLKHKSLDLTLRASGSIGGLKICSGSKFKCAANLGTTALNQQSML